MMQTTQFPYKGLCKKIINIDRNIRFAGIINNNGRLITGAVKDNIQSYVDESEREMLFMSTTFFMLMIADSHKALRAC